MYIYLLTVFSLINANCAIRLSESCRNFSLEIVYFTSFGNEPSNIVLSPFSLWTLMYGVRLAASGTGERELREALILPIKNDQIFIDRYRNLRNQVVNDDSTGVSIMSNNTVLLNSQFQINSNFSVVANQDFRIINAKDNNLDAAAETVSDALPESGIRVRNVVTLKDSNTTTRIIFANWMHFTGLWGLSFDKSATAVEPFYDETGKIIGEVNMMYQRNRFPFVNVKEMNAFVLELPYGDDGKYGMLILLPWAGKSVTEVYEAFSEFPFKNIFYKLYNDTQRYGLDYIDVRIPRFKIGTHVELVQPLNNMNVNAIFMAEDSNFSKIGHEPLHVSSVTQIADIEVTESGAVAADTHKAESSNTVATPGYTANKPFIYFIVEKTTVSIIYAGVYSKPTVY